MGGYDTGPKDDQQDSQAEMHRDEALVGGIVGLNDGPVEASEGWLPGEFSRRSGSRVALYLEVGRGHLSSALDPGYRESAEGS